MRYLVVGGAGYIGSHLVQTLCDVGGEVVVFDNLSSNIDQPIDKRAEFVKGDIQNLEHLYDLFNRYSNEIDCVFHFAAYKDAGASMEPFGVANFAGNNICGTKNLLDMMLLYEVKNIVFSSTAAVYGVPQHLPIDENHPTVPSNFYGESKLIVESLLRWYSEVEGINYAALRYFNAAGYDLSGRIKGKERNPSNLLPVVMEAAIGKRECVNVYGDDYDTSDGTGIRDYIHVDDLVNAHLLAASYIHNRKTNITVNLGTTIGYSVYEVIMAAREITGRFIPTNIVPRRKGDVATVIASAEKAYDLLSWKAEHSDLYTILSSMWKVYREQD